MRRPNFARAPFLLLLLTLLISFSFIGCATHPSAEERVKKHFRIPPVKPTDAARKHLLEKFPVGTSAGEIYSFAEDNGIGKDRLSSCAPLDKRNQTICRVLESPLKFSEPRESFSIFFMLDKDKKLMGVHVQKLDG